MSAEDFMADSPRRGRPRPGLRATRAPRWQRHLPTSRAEWVFSVSIILGFAIGLTITLNRDLLPESYNLDARRIYGIASGQMPEFADRSYTPVGVTYRLLGLGASPTAAALFGYALAVVVIITALIHSGRRTASLLVGCYILATFALAGVYLGQYSKDIFILPIALLIILLPRPIWVEIFIVASMIAYAILYRDYWAITAAAYVVLRIITIRQVRMRYLLAIGAFGAALAGLAFYFVLGFAPNHFRTAVQGHLDANTFIHNMEIGPQPVGGMIDVLINYGLLFAPVTLITSAGWLYVVVIAGTIFARAYPLMSGTSAVRWPAIDTIDGVLVRRSVSILIAFVAVQALFEPDYGSALRHLTPLMPIAIVLMQSARSGKHRLGRARPFSWSGAGAE